MLTKELPHHMVDCLIGEVVKGERVTVQINHAIIAAYDKQASSEFFAQVFNLPEPTYWGPFATVLLGDGAHLHFAEPPNVPEIQRQHYAFKVDDQQFNEIYKRVRNLDTEHWADPRMSLPDQINTNHGGRGFYFLDPTGHFLEVLTRSEVEE